MVEWLRALTFIAQRHPGSVLSTYMVVHNYLNPRPRESEVLFWLLVH